MDHRLAFRRVSPRCSAARIAAPNGTIVCMGVRRPRRWFPERCGRGRDPLHALGQTWSLIAGISERRLLAEHLARAVDGVAEALLRLLLHEAHVPTDLQDPARVGLGPRAEAVEVLDRDLVAEEGAELLEVGLLDDDHDLLDPGLERLFDDQQDRGLAIPSRSTTGNSSFLAALLGKSRVPKPAAGTRARRTAGPSVSVRHETPGRAPGPRPRPVGRAAGHELGGAVALGADPLAPKTCTTGWASTRCSAPGRRAPRDRPGPRLGRTAPAPRS